MDPLTQGLLGAASAQLGLRQKIGRDATWMAFLTAMAPDLDIFAPTVVRWMGIPTNGMTRHYLHRGLSHSLFMAPLIALPVALVWWLVRRRVLRRRQGGDRSPPQVGFRWLYACLALAVLTHAPLDWCTSYGTQILSPLTTTRYAIDAIGIIDLVYTPILLLTVLACYVVRKVRPGRSGRITLAIGLAGMLLSTGYIATGRVLRQRAIGRALAALPGDHAKVLRADAYPAIGMITLWRVVIETDGDWYVTKVHHLADPSKPPVFHEAPKQSANPWVRRALARRDAKSFAWFAMGRQRAEYTHVDGRHVVKLFDMRYGWPLDTVESLWWLEMSWDSSGRFLGTRRGSSRDGHDRGEMVAQMWRELWEY